MAQYTQRTQPMHRKKIPKTNAQRQKEYRMRKKMEKQQQSTQNIPKTNAERQREYRHRQKSLQQSEALILSGKKESERVKKYRKMEKQQKRTKNKPKTNAERQREYRRRQKNLQLNEALILSRKNDAERVKRYRDKLKLKKQLVELDSLLPSKEDLLPTQLSKETGHCPNTNCEELALSQFQTKTNQIQISMMNEAQQFEIKKETDDYYAKNCERLDSRQLQMQNQIQPVIKNEDQQFEIKTEIDYSHGTNCEELTSSKFQMQTNIMVPSIKNETEQVISPSFQAFDIPYEEHDECSTPNAFLHHDTNIDGDSSCLFSSLIKILNLQISASELRQQLYHSHYMNACQNPTIAKKILSSDLEYGDSDCLFLFSRTYNQNICVHFHYFNNNTKREVVRFCYFKVNDSKDFLHLHLRDTHFTPYIVVQEIVQNIKIKFQQNEDCLSQKEDQNECSFQKSSYEIKIEQSSPVHFENVTDAEIESSKDTNSNSNYTNYYKHTHAHLEFYLQFHNNTFGHTCAVCNRLCWKSDLKKVSNVDKNLLQKIVPYYESSSRIVVCSTCKISLDRKKIPMLSTYNGSKYPRIPSHLPKLNLIEQRLISPRIPFIQIRRLGHVHDNYGQIFNVPVKNNTMLKKLPRNIENDHYFYVQVEEKIIHAASYVHSLINKNNIKEWLKYLVQTPLYIHHKIEIDDAFFNSDQIYPKLVIDNASEYVSIEDNLTAQQQILLWNADKILCIADTREQSSLPNSLFDEYAEELSFPTIYGGQFINYRKGITVTPFMQATSELRRSDRRGADPQHLLYLAAKNMRMRVTQSVTFALKHFDSSTTIHREQILCENFIEHCLGTDLAFLRCIPNSAWYWADSKKELFAMIRQLGAPTAFMMLSANETGWTNLVKLLYKVKNNNMEISDEFISNMDYAHRAKLVNEDPVICAIYFNKLVNCLLKILQYKKRSPFGKYRLLNYFKRIEFPHRGRPQVHILLWLNNAPKNTSSNDKDVIQMIDEFVSVSKAESSGNIQLQTHKHSFACCMKTDPNQNDNCRFGAPFMPSRNTITLYPMIDADSDFSEQNFNEYKNQYKLIRTNLEKFYYSDFHNFYAHNNIASDEHYYNIIRAGIDRPKLLYRRTPSEIWHIPFNPFVLHHLKSNMDFQIILDEYACADYVFEYYNQHDKGISYLQRQIIQIMDENPEFNISDITKKISIDGLNSVEMSVQEAAWFLLREPTAISSTPSVYIPTIHPSERLRIRKSLKESNELGDDCTDDWFDKYEKRPEELNSVTLAQFVAKYYINKKRKYTERDTPKIIRYCSYDEDDSFNDYRREMVLLHIPFRTEDDDVLADDKFLEIYENNKDLIEERRKEFELNLDMHKTLEICKQLCTVYDENELNTNVIFKKEMLV